MKTQSSGARPSPLGMDHLKTGAIDASNRRMSSTLSTPLSSAPNTPKPHTPNARRPSYSATSPLDLTSPKPPHNIRRASSAMNLNQRTTSSPNLVRKNSRTSLGAQPEDNDKRPTPKRSISNLITGLREAQSKMESIEEPVPLTAPRLAVEHFTKELMAHANPQFRADTVVILHDACYGHRYSRLKTTKTTVSMIVERPERIHASVLGASTAYVRLGEHHAGGSNAPQPDRRGAAPPPFKIRRTERSMDITSSYVTSVHGTSWMSELNSMCHSAGERLAAGAKELSRSATPTEPEKRRLHEGDLYLSPESLNAFQGALGGVADAVDTVFAPATETERAFVAIRPPGHHCSADYPSGFCWINNVHVGIEYAAQSYGLTHAAILDFDLHHGDGSQAITWERNSRNNTKRLNAKPNAKMKLAPDIGYYSLHDINSYPCEMGDDEKVQAASLCIDNAHGQSIWNVHLQPWKTEVEFWELYETKYRVILDKARQFLRHHTARLRADGKIQPKAALFISAGFDASEWEGAGMQRHKVNVPTEFYARFTRDVVKLAQEASCGCDGRVVSVLEGGYSDRALCSGVLSHLSGLCAEPIVAAKKEASEPLELDQMMRGLQVNGASTAENLQYDTTWWSAENLTALELKVNPPPPPGAKKVRTGNQPTYATPTESFAYKVVDTDKFARSISGTIRLVERPARPPTPPPPEVDWVVATQELSKLLIPTDRQTKSCTPEELAGVRTKKDRVSGVSALATEETAAPRQLRDRKIKAPAYAGSAHSDELETARSVSRSSRRQTIADLPSATDEPEPVLQRRVSRRLSAGSTLSSITSDLDIARPPVPTLPTAVIGTAKPAVVAAPAIQVKKIRLAPAKAVKAGVASAPVSPVKAMKPSAGLAERTKPALAATGNDVDALTSGMKKISLRVGTKEEHDRKQKERLAAERRARGLKAAETRKANAMARKTAVESVVQPVTAATKQSVEGARENAFPNLPEPEAAPMEKREVATLPSYEPVNTGTTTMATMLPDYFQSGHSAVPHQEYNATEFVDSDQHSPPPQRSNHGDASPYKGYADAAQQPDFGQPDLSSTAFEPGTSGSDSTTPYVPSSNSFSNGNAPSDGALPSTDPLSSPLTSASGHRLPVFSSTGMIPFATAPGRSVGQDVGQVSTPDAAATGTGVSNAGPSGSGSAPSGETVTATTSTAQVNQESIWDVPETPQR